MAQKIESMTNFFVFRSGTGLIPQGFWVQPFGANRPTVLVTVRYASISGLIEMPTLAERLEVALADMQR